MRFVMKKIKFKIYMTSFALVLFCIFEPLILFVSGYFAGWILKVTIGSWVVNCMNIAFATNRFTVEMFPMFFAAMTLIGGFFKSSRPILQKNDK